MWVGVCLAALLLGAMKYYLSFVRTRGGEAPFVHGALPFLGVATAFSNNPVAFLQGLRDRVKSSAVTVLMAGNRTTFLMNPHDMSVLFRNSRKLQFSEFANNMSTNAFDHGPFHETVEDWDEGVGRDYVKYLTNVELSSLTEQFQRQVNKYLFDTPSAPPVESRAKLHRFVIDVVFFGGANALFGDAWANKEVQDAFETFDSKFALLLAGVKPRWLPGIGNALDTMAKHLKRSKECPARSDFMKSRQEYLTRSGLTEDDIASVNRAILWASQANTVLASFWVVLQLLHHPEALAKVREEIDEVAASKIEQVRAGKYVFSVEELNGLKRCQSAIDETLRMRSQAMVMRIAREDLVLTLKDGPIRVRKGDRVCVLPAVTHMDKDLYERPEEYRWDRFLDRDPKSFTFQGEPCRYFLNAFGGGISRCPGRFFAMNEIKALVSVLVLNFDIELVDKVMPSFDPSRTGLGMIAPDKDVEIRIRKRD